MKTLIPAFTATLAITMAASATPRLVVSTPSLVPESQIDLVLDSPVTETAELGKAVDNTWLEIQPALPGKLLWKASNIAQFIPEQAPAIGATYTFSIPRNRQHLDQSAVPAGKFAMLASDSFRIVAANAPDRWNEDYSPSTSAWLIVFNDTVDPASAANFISFTSGSGQRVAAKLERATTARAGYYATTSKPWEYRFPNTLAPASTPETLAPCILLATPISPLPAGDGWVVSALKGLPNESAAARTTEDSTYEIGKIEPFKVTQIAAQQNPNEPRKLVIDFNQITLTGDLADLGKTTVTFRPPFTSASGFDLNKALTQEVTFGHFIPVLSFPSQDQAQLANGSREYRMLTLNLEKTRLRIKKLSGADQVRAFQGYRHVTHHHSALLARRR
jgi:alpha-2-macroglobulin